MTNKDHLPGITNRVKQVARCVIALKLNNVLNDTAFANSVGEYQQTFSRYGKNRNPTTNVLCNICEEYEINPEWLFFGTGAISLTNSALNKAHLLFIESHN